jgi:hypothetical protein
MDLTGGAVNDGNGLSGMVYEQLLPGPVILAHYQIQLTLPGLVMVAEPAVFVAIPDWLPGIPARAGTG